MKSLIGKNFSTSTGEKFQILNRRKSRTFPFFETFYIYDILWKDTVISIKCKDLTNLINGKPVFLIFD